MEVTKELLVIDHYNGKALITDELGFIYYLECSENEAPVGTVVEGLGVRPISLLPEEERETIEGLL